MVHQPVSLKQLAARLGLNPATVSVVLNDVPGRSIPQVTRDRIKAAVAAWCLRARARNTALCSRPRSAA